MNEIEAKFCVADHAELADRLGELGASLQRARHFERNWRFDRPDRSLSQAGMVFRLRSDPQATLTVKRSRASDLERDEFELAIGDAEDALRLIESLGYETFAVYEKYRTVYALRDTEVMLDELPFGNFAELEGQSVPAIEQLAAELRLDWSRRVPHSYLTIFEQLRQLLKLDFSNATFADFEAAPPIDLTQLEIYDAAVQPERG